jgi:hypothetical protein
MTQSVFAKALLNPDAPLPPGIIDPQGRPAPKRFDVYRNNVTASLTAALEVSFPAVAKLVGLEFFRATALVFLRAHPPKSRIMMLYGDEFPAFLQTFPPAVSLGYLADVARLEQAIRESYHSVDATPIDPARVTQLDEAQLMAARLRLAPSLRLLKSDWPQLSIWQATLHAGEKPQMQPQDVVVLRKGFDPAPHLLPAAGAGFLTAILQGETLGHALDYAGAEFDLTPMLTLLFQNQAIVGIDT